MKTSLLFAALATVLILAPTSEAVCANQPVYDDCRNRGDTQLASCASDNFVCQCDARKAIQNCFLQCQDDPDKVNESKAYQPAVQQACSLAASQTSAQPKASATTTATPTAETGKQSADTGKPTANTEKPSAEPSKTDGGSQASPSNSKSAAGTNKVDAILAMIALYFAAIVNL